MVETITVDVKLRAFVRKEKKTRWVAVCPSVGVASQGQSAEQAKKELTEAVQLWFESCIERGTLERALQEANFRPVPSGEPVPAETEVVTVNRQQEADVLGDPFVVRVEIPAYQAAALTA